MIPKRTSLPIGHICALITVFVWGATFIASKHMLSVYTPVQIMTLRFVIAYGFLWILYPHAVKAPLKDEAVFLLLGILGNSLYFLLENTSLTYTLASNTSIILSAAPLFTAILAHLFGREDRLTRYTVYGSLLAFFGVILVIFNGTIILKLNPLGDLLAVLAALSWATYTVILRRYTFRYDGFLLARRVTFWGILTATPLFLAELPSFSFTPMKEPTILGSWLFLALLGSGLCYVLWNTAVAHLGAVKTNNYIFLQPFITMLCGFFLLSEPISLMGIIGAFLIISGIVFANRKRPV